MAAPGLGHRHCTVVGIRQATAGEQLTHTRATVSCNHQRLASGRPFGATTSKPTVQRPPEQPTATAQAIKLPGSAASSQRRPQQDHSTVSRPPATRKQICQHDPAQTVCNEVQRISARRTLQDLLEVRCVFCGRPPAVAVTEKTAIEPIALEVLSEQQHFPTRDQDAVHQDYFVSGQWIRPEPTPLS